MREIHAKILALHYGSQNSRVLAHDALMREMEKERPDTRAIRLAILGMDYGMEHREVLDFLHGSRKSLGKESRDVQRMIEGPLAGYGSAHHLVVALRDLSRALDESNTELAKLGKLPGRDEIFGAPEAPKDSVFAAKSKLLDERIKQLREQVEKIEELKRLLVTNSWDEETSPGHHVYRVVQGGLPGTSRAGTPLAAEPADLLARSENAKKKILGDPVVRKAFPPESGVREGLDHPGIEQGKLITLQPRITAPGGAKIEIRFIRVEGGGENHHLRLSLRPV